MPADELTIPYGVTNPIDYLSAVGTNHQQPEAGGAKKVHNSSYLFQVARIH